MIQKSFMGKIIGIDEDKYFLSQLIRNSNIRSARHSSTIMITFQDYIPAKKPKIDSIEFTAWTEQRVKEIFKVDKLTFICLENTFEWKQMCHADTYMRPWYRKDLSSAHE